MKQAGTVSAAQASAKELVSSLKSTLQQEDQGKQQAEMSKAFKTIDQAVSRAAVFMTNNDPVKTLLLQLLDSVRDSSKKLDTHTIKQTDARTMVFSALDRTSQYEKYNFWSYITDHFHISKF